MEGAASFSRAALEVLGVDQPASPSYLRGRDGARRGHLLSPGWERCVSGWPGGAGPGGAGAGLGGGAGQAPPRGPAGGVRGLIQVGRPGEASGPQGGPGARVLKAGKLGLRGLRGMGGNPRLQTALPRCPGAGDFI